MLDYLRQLAKAEPSWEDRVESLKLAASTLP